MSQIPSNVHYTGFEEIINMMRTADEWTRQLTDGRWRIDWGFNQNDYQNRSSRPRRELTELERRRNRFQKKSPKLKRKLIERDGECCARCGTIEKLCVDHVIPLKWGGLDDLENLQLLCRSCNSKKRDVMP